MNLRALCIAVSLIGLLAVSGCGGSSEETTETAAGLHPAFSRCFRAKFRAVLEEDENQPPKGVEAENAEEIAQLKTAAHDCARSLVRSGRYTQAEVTRMLEEHEGAEIQLIH